MGAQFAFMAGIAVVAAVHELTGHLIMHNSGMQSSTNSPNYRLEDVDHVPGDVETTQFKRRARLHQSLWRESRGIPVGSQPMRPKSGQSFRELGSRIDVQAAREKKWNFLSKAAEQAAEHRLKNPQPHQTLNADRLYADLLSSMPMCFNLFAPLRDDLELANRAVRAWWPHVPGTVVDIRFEWSPGRRKAGRFLENASAFDVAFELDLGFGQRGLLGVETKYHENCRREAKRSSDSRIARYSLVSERSGAFLPGAVDRVFGTELQQIWLDHLLALSMTQDESEPWHWTGFALVHPACNPSYARAAARYRQVLHQPDTLTVSTLESLLNADVLPAEMTEAFKQRYLWAD